MIAAEILINEYFPNPEGSIETSEWIELFNASDNEIDLSVWKIDDIADGGSPPHSISSGSIIGAKSFFILERTVTGIILNNDTDKIRLINGSNEIVDEHEYVETEENASYGRKTDGGSDWAKFSTFTKNDSNESGIIIPSPTLTIHPTDEPTKTPTAIKTLTPTKTPTYIILPTENSSPTSIKKIPTSMKIIPTKKKEQIVLGEINEKPTRIKTPFPTLKTEVKGSSGFNPGTIFISLGGILLLACGILTFYMKKNNFPDVK